MADFAMKKLKKTADGRVVNFSGDMTVNYACEVRDALLQVVSGEEKVILNLKGITRIDLTGLQLLCSAHQAALAADKILLVEGKNETFISVAFAAGLTRHVGCKEDRKKTCVWLGGQ